MIKSRGESKVGRNSFDLTNRHVYTQKAAKITPVKAFHTMPDDYIEVKMEEFSQNNIPMNTAAFLSGKKENLAYFVPYNTIWHNFNQFQATREDPESTLLNDKGISYEPRIAIYDLYKAGLFFTIGAWLVESWCDVYALWKWYVKYQHNLPDDLLGADSKCTIPELVDYMKSHYTESDTLSDWDYFRKYALSYVKDTYYSDLHSDNNYPLGIYHTCYEYDVKGDTYWTYGDMVLNMFDSPIWCDWLQKLDMLGYGNIYPLMHDLRVQLDKLVNDVLTNSNSAINVYDFYINGDGNIESPGDSFEDTIINSILIDPEDLAADLNYWSAPVVRTNNKLLSMCTYDDGESTGNHEYVNVYALYAYNKCFYDYMRNTYYDDDYSVYNFNCDFINGSSFAGSIITPSYIPSRFYHLECHQWKKDMFTGVLPDNQLGQVSNAIISTDISQTVRSGSADFSKTSSQVWNADSDTPITNEDMLTDSAGNLVGSVGGTETKVRVTNEHTHTLSSDITVDGQLNVLALKRAEAIQQYRQDLMRAGNRTKDVFQQIYGVTPKSQLDETPYFIEVASSDINVNPIIATAQTEADTNGKLGSIAARSTISGGSLTFKFSTKDFGVVLFLSYIVPESMYNSYRLDPCVTHLDPEAHGLPYFQNLGLQPVIGEFLCNLFDSDVRHRVHGFAPPYIERKTDIDLVHGNLVDCYLPSIGEGDVDVEYQGELSHWVVARTDMQQEDAVSLRNFYIDPRILNNVFQFEAGSDYSTDHFLTYSSIQINAVRALSEIGLPHF